MTKKSNKVDGRPAYQFYVDDWTGDDALQLCSLAARGLWKEMLCRMFKSPVRGHLLKANGKQITSKELAGLVNAKEEEVEQLLDELDDEAVFSRLEDKTIYSRRQVRDEAKRQQKIEAGRKGGEAYRPSEQEAGEEAKHQVKGGPSTPTPTPTSTSKKKEILSPELEEAFREVYNAYGKKVDPKEARIQFRVYMGTTNKADYPEFTRSLIANIRRQDKERAKVKSAGGFVAEKCTLARWLKHERWDNVYEVDKTATRNEDSGPEEQPDMIKVKSALEILENVHVDHPDWPPERIKGIIFGTSKIDRDRKITLFLSLRCWLGPNSDKAKAEGITEATQKTTWKLWRELKGVTA